MKKILILVTAISLGALLIAGCQTTSSETSLPASDAANSVGQAVYGGLYIDNLFLDGTGVVAAGVSALQAYTITPEADNWFHATASFTEESRTIEEDVHFKVWDDTNTEVTDVNQLNSSLTINKVQIFGTITISQASASFTVAAGTSKTDPLTVTYAPSRSIDGPIAYACSVEDDEVEVTFDYGNLTTTDSGIPTGTVNWALYLNGNQVYAGSIVFDGTTTAVITFTSGASGSYDIDLTNGAVTPQ